MRHIWMCLPVALCYPAMAQSLAAPVREALHNNREILAAQKRYDAARQRPSIASSLPDPMAPLAYTSNGKRKLRGETAEKEAEAFMRVTEARYAVGRSAQQDVLRAGTQYSSLERRTLRMAEEKAAKQAGILSLLNRPQGGLIEAPILWREQKMVERGEPFTNPEARLALESRWRAMKPGLGRALGADEHYARGGLRSDLSRRTDALYDKDIQVRIS